MSQWDADGRRVGARVRAGWRGEPCEMGTRGSAARWLATHTDPCALHGNKLPHRTPIGYGERMLW